MKKIFVFLLVLSCLCCAAFAADAKTADAAMVKWTDGTQTFEGTFGECMAKVNEFGGTMTMLEDVTGPGTFPTTRNDIDDADYIIGSAKGFTLDLNGHTLYAPECGAIYVNPLEEGGMFTVKNGTIRSDVAENIYVANCGLQAINVTMRSVKSQNISYYDPTDRYNKDNVIDGCTISNPIWFCFSFNNAKASQEQASMTIINSSLMCAKSAAAVGLQKKAISGNIVLGEGVKLYSYSGAGVSSSLKVFGEPLTKTKAVTATFGDLTYDLLNEFATPEKPTMDIAALIPGETAPTTEIAPALRKVTIVPLEEQQKEEAKTEDTAKEETPEAKEAGSAGVIIGIVAAVVVIAVAAVVVLKKKKK